MTKNCKQIYEQNRQVSKMLDEFSQRAPDFSDPLTDNTKGYKWTEVRQTDGSCVFSSNGYHVTTLHRDYRFYKGFSEVLVLSNFVLQVDMKVMAGEEGGVLFRWYKGIPDTFYYFYIRTDGIFGLEKGVETRMPDKHRILVGEPNNQYVNKGLNQQNKLRVRAVGHEIELYVNEQFLDRIDDNTNPHDRGHVGFASGRKPSEVIFSNVKIWKIN
jgi:hypothetical protein